jgi:predicted RNA binding protein YcfA (HicA-like mRNA interferase family)
MNNTVIKLPFNVTHASENTIKALINAGYLEVREDGIHAKEKAPTMTATSD